MRRTPDSRGSLLTESPSQRRGAFLGVGWGHEVKLNIAISEEDSTGTVNGVAERRVVQLPRLRTTEGKVPAQGTGKPSDMVRFTFPIISKAEAGELTGYLLWSQMKPLKTSFCIWIEKQQKNTIRKSSNHVDKNLPLILLIKGLSPLSAFLSPPAGSLLHCFQPGQTVSFACISTVNKPRLFLTPAPDAEELEGEACQL